MPFFVPTLIVPKFDCSKRRSLKIGDGIVRVIMIMMLRINLEREQGEQVKSYARYYGWSSDPSG